ncbi:MAG: TIGR01777 family protein [Puniceicoccaceae bacterium]|nr:MAG: TIGR01777 family protein [Puniceicoccaceae bacterium]
MSQPKTILITGASGLIGSPLCLALKARGHTVRTLSRGDGGDFQWDPAAGTMDASAVEGVDAIIHLAGESVAQRWTAAVKERILNSRVASTRLLVEGALKQSKVPGYIAASGISYYGIDRERSVDESSETGRGFLAEVTRQWEGAAQQLETAGSRCVYLRTGIVLSAKGGALAKMLLPFKMGVGGRIGHGQQKMSWISLDDLVQIYVFAVENEAVRGPINAVAPEPVSNNIFTKTLGKVLHRPTIFPMPALVVESLFGEMGRETVLSNLGVKPKRLVDLGFQWQQPQLETALSKSI